MGKTFPTVVNQVQESITIPLHPAVNWWDWQGMTRQICTWELYTLAEPTATQQHGIKKTAPEKKMLPRYGGIYPEPGIFIP